MRHGCGPLYASGAGLKSLAVLRGVRAFAHDLRGLPVACAFVWLIGRISRQWQKFSIGRKFTD
jgi:hypothetical protein